MANSWQSAGYLAHDLTPQYEELLLVELVRLCKGNF